MSSVGNKGIVILDRDGEDSVTVTDGRLDVNATIGASVTVALDSSGDSVECIQDTPADLKATVTQADSNRTVNLITGFATSTLQGAGLPSSLSNGKLNVNIGGGTSGGAGAPFKATSDAWNEDAIGIAAMAVCSDTLAPLTDVTNGEWTPNQVDTKGALYTTHGMTGMVQGITTVGVTAMQLDEGTDGYDIPCKRVDLMSRHDNTGKIYVGSANTIAANGSVGGIRLDAGDFYSIDINNLTHIWVEATAVDQELIFIYYT